MSKKIFVYGVVGLLAVALVAGSAFILLRPADAEAEQGRGYVAAAQAGNGNGRGARSLEQGGFGAGSQGLGSGGNGGGTGASGRGQGVGQSEGQGRGQGQSEGQGRGQGAGNGIQSGESAGLEQHPADTWIALSGTVVAVDDELTVRTEEGEVVAGTGPTWYWDENGLVLEPGDEVVLHGFYEDGEFKLGSVENLSTGDAFTVRDEIGRPLWAGRGRLAE
jgi:hypothetical protein